MSLLAPDRQVGPISSTRATAIFIFIGTSSFFLFDVLAVSSREKRNDTELEALGPWKTDTVVDGAGGGVQQANE